MSKADFQNVNGAANDDISMDGVGVSVGSLAGDGLASSRRNESQFALADTLNIQREPNRRPVFEMGAHDCKGARLARMEAQTASHTLWNATYGIPLDVESDSLRWSPGLVARGLDSRPIDSQTIIGWNFKPLSF